MAWNGSGGAANVPRKGYGNRTADSRATSRSVPSARHGWLRGIVAAFAVAVVSGGAWWLLSCNHVQQDEAEARRLGTPKTRRVKDIAPKSAAASSGGAAQRLIQTVDSSSNEVDNAEAFAAAAQEARLNKWKEKFARRRSIFTNGSDQILGMIASTPPGRDMPPLPITKSIDHDFMKSLDTPIEILDGDSAEVRAAKEAVIKLRAEVLAIKESEGLSVYEILTQHQSLLRENAALRIEAQKEALDIYKSGDVELAREYVDKANEKLIELGSEPIRMPGTENPELRQHIREKLQTIKSKRNQQGRQ